MNINHLICTKYLNYYYFFFFTEIDGGHVGLTITQAISLTGIIQWLVKQSSEFDNQMTSVERLIEYSKIPQEAPFQTRPSIYIIIIIIIRLYDKFKNIIITIFQKTHRQQDGLKWEKLFSNILTYVTVQMHPDRY